MTAERVFVGLGANLGEPRQALRSALAALAALPNTRLVACSAFYRSAPVDAAGPDYLNAVAELSTAVEPLPLLHALQAIERAHGRQRPYHHAPRTLDLDLLLYGQRRVALPELTVPHPRLHQRAFALIPLLEIAPDLGHPDLGALADHCTATADQALERLS